MMSIGWRTCNVQRTSYFNTYLIPTPLHADYFLPNLNETLGFLSILSFQRLRNLASLSPTSYLSGEPPPIRGRPSTPVAPAPSGFHLGDVQLPPKGPNRSNGATAAAQTTLARPTNLPRRSNWRFVAIPTAPPSTSDANTRALRKSTAISPPAGGRGTASVDTKYRHR
ncbi:hypothetical protein B0H67DRAFT_198783 [Lasiosphaeris hirsuta]|uniref:Uncharacterized protein n=1 Tax=Lasiosphaeris hirsuta TaxID=260670 RepID=A0AA40E2X6_9PEZI|nr:hypothetical protein B0H67DRAFT_198783 [Lasiosphaeris hirsuta]